MDLIKYKIRLYSGLTPLITDYVKIFAQARKHAYGLVDGVEKQVAVVDATVAALKSAAFDSAESIFLVVHNVNTATEALEKIFDALTSDASGYPTEMSNTFMLDLESNLRRLEIKYSIARDSDASSTVTLVHRAVDMLKDYPMRAVTEQFVKHKNTADLYAHYLQHRLDTTDPDSREYVGILNAIEDAKMLIMRIEKTTSVTTQRFGLIPRHQHRGEDQLLAEALSIVSAPVRRNPGRMYGGYAPSNLSKLSAMCREKKIGLFVMVRISSTSVYFDFAPLMVRQTTKPAPFAGVTVGLIDKFNVKDSPGHDKAPHQNLRLGHLASDKWLIVRTLNGTHYDIMGLDTATFVDRAFTDKIDRGASPLIATYQKAAELDLRKFLTLPRAVVLEADTTPLQGVANAVVHKVTEFVNAKLSSPPTGLKELFDMVSGGDIEEIVSRIVIQSYEGLDAARVELSSTFLANADRIINGFVKSIKESFAKSGFSEFMFKEKTDRALVEHIRTGVVAMIKEAAGKAFDPRNDIYEAISVKKALLAISM